MKRGRPFGGSGAGALLAAACFCGLAPAFSAAAQDAGSVSDYRLPPGPSSTSAPAGPVDPDVPAVRPTRTPAEPAVTPTSSPQVAPPEPAPERTARPSPAPPPRSTAPVAAPTTPAPLTTAPFPGPAVPPAEGAAPAAPAEAPAGRETGARAWLAIVAILAALLALAGLAWMRARARGEREPEPRAPRPAMPEPSAPAALPLRQPQSAPQPAAHTSTEPIVLSLEAGELSRSLVYATLSYRLLLTNASDGGLGPLDIAGDLASAHASLTAADQLAPASGMEILHRVARLAPGETVTLAGNVRLALSAIRPIRQGEAMLFVPLVRFRIMDEDGSAQAVRVFVVGEPGRGRADALRPLRIDGFPGVIRPLGSHEILLDGALAAG